MATYNSVRVVKSQPGIIIPVEYAVIREAKRLRRPLLSLQFLIGLHTIDTEVK